MSISHPAGFALLAILLHITPAAADEGHSHDAPPAAAGGPALPRFAATSELFELVGVVDGRQITLWLDRFDDNAPVKHATVELEVGGAKVAVKAHGDGEFRGELAKALDPGVTPVTATVVADGDADLLAAELDIHAEANASEAPARGWRSYAPWAAGAAAAALLLAWRGRRSTAAHRAGDAA